MPTSSLRSAFPAITLAMLGFAGTAVTLHADARAAVEQSTVEPYALVRDGQRTTFVGSRRSSDMDIDALRQQYPGNFIWFRQSGQAYVVRDASVLAQVAAAWAPADKTGQGMSRLEAQMRVQSEAMQALGAEMTAATRGAQQGRGDPKEIGARMDKLGKAMDVLGKQMGALGKQMEAHSKRADATSRDLFQAAVASGAAQLVPALPRASAP